MEMKLERRTNEITEEDCKFRPGQLLKFVKVRFPGNSKSFSFFVGNRIFHYGQRIVALSDRGMAVGYISSFPYEVPFAKSMLPIQIILKTATEKELDKEVENVDKEQEAKKLCEDLIKKLKLDMDLTHVEYTQFGKKAVFYFTAAGRVDFRELVKELVAKLKMRIELRQIHIRDRTAGLGGIGPCGRQLCCCSFLPKYGYVNIKMAKNQNITLSPTKLNGICGQLKCCFQYEDETYQQKRSKLPGVYTLVKTQNGDFGKVEKLHVLCEEFEMLTTEGRRRRYKSTQYNSEVQKDRPTVQFPSSFEYIVDETSNVIV